MKKAKFRDIYDRIMRGEYGNIDFEDACAFVEELGFKFRRQRGSHHIYKMDAIPELINLQNKNGNAKPYQVKEIRKIIVKYKIEGGEHGED